MNQRLVIDGIIIVLVLVVAAILIHISVKIKSEGYKCQSNPLVYAATKYGEANGAEFVGSGTLLKGENSVTVYFNKDNITVKATNPYVTPQIFIPDLFNVTSLVN